jgi:elongation factor Ts
MEISASLVRELRERTNAPMMECKKALVASQGDIEAAIDAMRKAGQAKADKKAHRTAAEGLIVICMNDNETCAVMTEINCETDFVARDSNFIHFTQAVTQLALDEKIADKDALLNKTLNAEGTVEDARKALVAKIGENINIRRIALFDVKEGKIGMYVHGGRIGVLAHVKGEDSELAKSIAMHIAANNPQVVSPSDVSPELIAKEKAIYIAQAQESGKPAAVVEKMIEGRLNKFLDEVSLLGQAYVKDPDITVGALLKAKKAEVVSFVRYAVGEGIEKQEVDFASEVMAQVQGSSQNAGA